MALLVLWRLLLRRLWRRSALISPQNVAKALNKTKTEFERSSELTLQLHSRVGQRTKDFYVIVEILRSIPTLGHLAELLAPEQASGHITQAASGKTAASGEYSGEGSGKASKHLHQASGRKTKTSGRKTAVGEGSSESSGEDSACGPRHVSGQAGLPSELAERPSNRDAFLALLLIANEWKTIGTLLDLSPGCLNSIEKENIKEHDRLREMVALWLETLDATWKDLIAAVKTLNKARASEIEKEWCS